MKCPRCVQNIHRAASTCPHCGFALGDADQRFGEEPVRLRCLTDAAGVLRRNERETVEWMMETLGRRFPQLFVAIYTGSVGGVAELRQFGFWLLNRAEFEDAPPEKPNRAAILLVMDPDAKAAAISYGYLLDPFLGEEDTFDCLSRAHAYWLEGRYREGMMRVLSQLQRVLRLRSRQARRDPVRFARMAAAAAPGSGEGRR